MTQSDSLLFQRLETTERHVLVSHVHAAVQHALRTLHVRVRRKHGEYTERIFVGYIQGVLI
jgi:hypothetical protein